MRRYMMGPDNKPRREATIELEVFDDGTRWQFNGQMAPVDALALADSLKHWAKAQSQVNPVTSPQFNLRSGEGTVVARNGFGPDGLVYGSPREEPMRFNLEDATAICALVDGMVMVPDFTK